MNHGEYLELKDHLLSLESSYKQLDITSQLTQLNALTKVSTSTGLNDTLLMETIERRVKRVNLCLHVIMFEESYWSPVLEIAENLVLAPKVGNP